MSVQSILVLVEDPNWKKTRGLVPKVKRAAAAALAACSDRAGLKGKSALTILLAGDKKLQALNHDFRGKDKSTNVLSFPADAISGRTAGRENAKKTKIKVAFSLADAQYLGDIAIAYGVTRKEAAAAGKTLTHHAAHLAVHGVLHLAGYDHETPRDARIMEPLEVKILNGLGIADPYKATSP